jgi:hypothetical protein
VIIALWTVSFRLGECPNLLLFLAEDDNVLSFVREPINYLVTTTTRVSTLYARHEDFLLLLRGKKSGTALWTKLQKLVSSQRRLYREFILYPEVLEDLL